MWMKLAVAGTLLLIQSVVADDCPFTVSVLDVAGVQCVPSAPCSGTYYATGLSQGVGACPTGANCALLPQTPIMGCAASGRSDLIYVNSDGTLTKDGKSVTLSDATVDTTESATSSPATSSPSISPTNSTPSSNSETSVNSNTANNNIGNNGSNGNNNNSNNGYDKSGKNDSTGNIDNHEGNENNARSGSGSIHLQDTEDGNDMTKNPVPTSTNSSDSHSHASENGLTSQQSFNLGSLLSDGANTNDEKKDGSMGTVTIIAICVGCLAVVAVAVGARLLRKGSEAELVTPGASGLNDGYNNGGGGSGMTPKENVLLL